MRQLERGMAQLVIALPHGGSVTVKLNLYLVIEHPILGCRLCVDALYVTLWNYFPYNPNPNPTITLPPTRALALTPAL